MNRIFILSLFLLGSLQTAFGYNLMGYWSIPPKAQPYDPINVHYKINEDGDPGCTNGDEFDAIKRAFQTWQKILTTYVSLIYSTVYTLTFNLKEEG
jgi:hypothetical protein